MREMAPLPPTHMTEMAPPPNHIFEMSQPPRPKNKQGLVVEIGLDHRHIIAL
jgi:hypothetical protein